MKSKDYGIFFWIHLFVDALLFFSWLLFSWWIIIIGFVLIRLQFVILKGCFLSKLEFGRREACIVHYLYKWKLVKNKKRTAILIAVFMPIIIITAAIIWQIVLGIKPLIF